MGGNEHEGGHGFHGNPVLNALTALDVGHAGLEVGVEGRHVIPGLRQLGEFGRHGAGGIDPIFTGKGVASAGTRALAYGTAAISPLAIAGGTMEIIDGINQIRHGDTAAGAVTTTAGAATAGSGVAGIAALGGSAAGAAAAPLLSAAALGLKVGSFGNEDVRERGWFEDDDGNSLSASEWAANNAQSVDEWVSERTWGPLGTAAGLATAAGSSVVGAGAAAGSAALSAGEWVGEQLFGGPSLTELVMQAQAQEQDGPTMQDIIQQTVDRNNAIANSGRGPSRR